MYIHIKPALDLHMQLRTTSEKAQPVQVAEGDTNNSNLQAMG